MGNLLRRDGDGPQSVVAGQMRRPRTAKEVLRRVPSKIHSFPMHAMVEDTAADQQHQPQQQQQPPHSNRPGDAAMDLAAAFIANLSPNRALLRPTSPGIDRRKTDSPPRAPAGPPPAAAPEKGGNPRGTWTRDSYNIDYRRPVTADDVQAYRRRYIHRPDQLPQPRQAFAHRDSPALQVSHPLFTRPRSGVRREDLLRRSSRQGDPAVEAVLLQAAATVVPSPLNPHQQPASRAATAGGGARPAHVTASALAGGSAYTAPGHVDGEGQGHHMQHASRPASGVGPNPAAAASLGSTSRPATQGFQDPKARVFPSRNVNQPRLLDFAKVSTL